MKVYAKAGTLIRVIVFVMMGLLFSGESARAAGKDIGSAAVVQKYIKTDNSGENQEPVVLLYDGKILEENVDYTLELLEDVDTGADAAGDDDYYDYTIKILGKGDYTGTAYIGTDYCGVEKSGYGIKYLYNAEESERYVIAYTGNSDKVDFDKISTNIVIDEVFAGVLCNNDTVKEIIMGEMDITDYLCINCPNVSMIKTDSDVGFTISGDKPGPIAAGELNGEVEIDVPIGFCFSYSDQNDVEVEMTIEKYCSEYTSFTVAGSSDSFQENGWNYRIDESREEAYIVSYKGTEADVVVPQKVSYNGNEYEIAGMGEYTFNGLTDLKSVDLGYLPITESMFYDCPNIKKITSKNRDEIELYDPVVDGNAPKENQLTISTYSDVVWEMDDDETEDGYREYTIQEYCEANGYVFEALQAQYINFTVAGEDSYLIAGTSRQLGVFCQDQDGYDEDLIDVKEIDSTANASDWEVLPEKSASIDSFGVITVSDDITEETSIYVKCIIDFKGQSIKATGEIKLYPRLTGTSNYTIVPPNSKKLSCSLYEYDEAGDEPAVVDIPEDVKVQFSVDNEKIVVDEEGYASAADGAETGDSAKVTAVYTIDGKQYVYVYSVAIGETQDVTDVGSDKIYVYGWEECGFDKVIKEFTAVYPKFADSIEYVEISSDNGEDEEDEEGSDDDWGIYRTGIDKAMRGEEKRPDIVLWPEDRVYENLSADYLVDLESIGFDVQGDYGNAFPYTKINGTWNDKLYAVTHEIDPGCFIYRKDLAREVLGNDDRETVQNAVKDWDSFLKTAAAFKEKNYYMTNAMNLNYPIFGGKSQSWVNDNVLNLEKAAKQYIDLQKQLYVNGYIQPNSENWDFPEMDDCSFMSTSFGYFVDYKFINDILKKSGKQSEYGICRGPVAYTVPDTVYMTATKDGHNDSLAKLFLQEMVSNTSIMNNSMKNGNGMINHSKGLESNIESDEMLAVLYDVASNITLVQPGIYDDEIESVLIENYDIASWIDDDLNVNRINNVDVDTLLDKIKRDCTAVLPESISVERIADEDKDTEESDPDDSGNEDNEDNTNKDDSNKDDSNQGGSGSTETKDTNSEKEGAEPNVTDDTSSDFSKGNENSTPASGDGKSDSGTNPGSHTHQYSEWVVVKAASCDEKGTKQRTCTVCGNVETLEIPALGFVKNGTFTKSNITYKILSVKGKKGTVSLVGLKKNKSKVSVPAKLKAGGITFTVTAISDNAFKGNAALKSVTVSKNITKIGKSAFENCKNLKTITIKSSKLTKKSFGRKSFKNVNSKVKIKCPKKKLASYKKWIKKAGAPKKAKYTK